MEAAGVVYDVHLKHPPPPSVRLRVELGEGIYWMEIDKLTGIYIQPVTIIVVASSNVVPFEWGNNNNRRAAGINRKLHLTLCSCVSVCVCVLGRLFLFSLSLTVGLNLQQA